MRKYKIRKGSIADRLVRFSHTDTFGVVLMSATGLALGAVIGIGMNEIHPLF